MKSYKLNIISKKNKLFVIFTLIFLSVANFTAAQTTITYAESHDLFANPERGLQKYSITNNSYNTQNNYTSLSANTLRNWRNSSDRVTVIFRYFLLSNFVDGTAISQRYLNNIQKDFDVIRDAGLKCLVRFSYSNGITDNAQQPTKAQILSHIEQLAPILEANRDVILTHQAGFLGTWGEWYYTRSSEFGDEGSMNNTQWNNRKDIIDAMLAATPVEIPLQVRYPQIKKRMYGNSTLTPETAYKNTPNARIGFYNDAFLNAWGDMGTYSVSQNQNPVGSADYTYLSNETQYTPMTGETNGLNAPRTDASNAMLEMDMTNWTCINRDYHGNVWNHWISADNSYDTILKHLGYRYVLKESTFSLSANSLNVSISLENKGYARLFKQRSLYLVLVNSSSGEQIKLEMDADPRLWDGDATINQTFDTQALPAGSYDAYLFLPDPNASLNENPDYAIRFANESIWDGSNGYNNLNQSLQIGDITQSVLSNSEKSLITSIVSDNQLQIQIDPEINNAAITLYSINGMAMTDRISFSGTEHRINIGNFPMGYYFIVLENSTMRVVENLLID